MGANLHGGYEAGQRKALPSSRSGFARNESGETLVSFALTLPVMLAFIFGLMEVCMGYYNYERISECAREGTRYAIVHGSTCETSAGASCTATATGIETFVNGIGLPNMGGGTMTPVATFPDGDEVPGHRVQVQITYTYPYKIPFMTTSALTIKSTSVMYILQ